MIGFVAAAEARGPQLQEARVEAAAYLERDAPRIARLAASFLNDMRDVEDAVQETLEAALRTWDSVLTEGSRRAWLNTICVRKCLRVRRWRLRHGTVPLRDDASLSSPSSDVDWETALARLSVPQRMVIILHYHHGYTLDECAAHMGRRPGTVRQHLARALAHLRRELRNER